MLKILPTTALAVAAIAIGAPVASASAPAVLYVSATAKAEPACEAASKTAPFKTISGALACAGDGTLVKIGTGQFAGGFTITHNVTLQGEEKAGATVVSSPGAAPQSLTEIADAAGTQVVLRDLTVDGGTDLTHSITGQRDILAGAGSLSLIGVTVENGAGYTGGGAGGVTVESSSGAVSLSLLDSTVSSNVGTGGGGVLVRGGSAAGAVAIDNSTITGNEKGAGAGAAGVFAAHVSVSLVNSTIDANHAGGFASGGIYLEHATDTLSNTIIAANSGGLQRDCSAPASTIEDAGNNIIGTANGESGDGCKVLANGPFGDQVGSTEAPIDARLAPLALNGGPTPTQALGTGSPAIGSGDPATCQATPVAGFDQRGTARNADSALTCDIGAWDAGAPSATLYVSARAKADPACALATKRNPFASIAGALACATNGTLIKLGAGHFAGGFTIAPNVTLQGVAKAGKTVISSPGAAPQTLTEITDAASAHVVLRDLTVNGESDKAHGTVGQRDIAAGEGALSLVGVTVENGDGLIGAAAGGITAGSARGAIALTVLDSTITANLGGNGGGIDESGPAAVGSSLTVDNSTIAANEVLSSRLFGAGIFAEQVNLSVVNSTIDGNGGGEIGGLQLLHGTGTITNTILAGNRGTLAPDCFTAQTDLQSGGHNLIGVGTSETPEGCGQFVNGRQGDQVGSAASPLAPRLGAPAANGGPTPTQALEPTSPAIDAGSAVACQAAPIEEKDQRGIARNAQSRGNCDIGAWDS